MPNNDFVDDLNRRNFLTECITREFPDVAYAFVYENTGLLTYAQYREILRYWENKPKLRGLLTARLKINFKDNAISN
jgi:hypothetical protein